jgi:hypothetical protein
MRRIAVAALLTAFFLQAFVASLLKSPTFDESAHLGAGVSYLSKRNFQDNLQHPPLMKELSAAFAMAGAGVRWRDTREAEMLLAHVPGQPGLQWVVGNALVAAYGVDRVMFWARLPMLLVSTLLGLLIYLWGRQVLGEAAALGALFLFAFDPTMLAHAPLVHTDMGLAAFTMLFLMALWNYLERPSGRGVLWCGLALGLALATKYSAVVLAPVALVLLASRMGRRAAGPFLGMCAAAFLVVEIAFLGRSPLLYLEGIRRVNADHDPNYLVFFAGEFATRFTGYFAGAYLLKEPLAAILAAGMGLLAVVRNRKARLFLLLPPAVLFAGYTLKADNLGVRYMIPTLPFAYLLGGAGMAWLWERRAKGARAAAVVLCGWVLVQAAAIWPDHLSYFNESACLFEDPTKIGLDGGTRCGPAWLDDSNVDWGQGLKQLRAWLDGHGVKGPIRMAYFGSFPPQEFGIQYADIDPDAPPAPGVYAVSAHSLSRLKVAGAWLGGAEPTAIVGHAYYIYLVK